ncbi:MAG: adenylate cyclase [Gammaproteobacteria bacterium]|jgi:adenylate cyclase
MSVNPVEFDEENEFRHWLSKYDPADQAPDELLCRFINGINQLGINVYRSGMWFPTAHPELWGTYIAWTLREGAKIFRPNYDTQSTSTFLNSPGEAVYTQRKALRWRLYTEESLPFPMLEDIKKEGGTDYLIVPFLTDHADEVPWISFVTKRAEGFSKLEINTLKEFCEPLSWKARVTMAEIANKSLLTVYLGENAAQRVIDGAFKRGTGEQINAIIWFCDLRGFTNLGDTYSSEELVEILDQYFECIAGPIEDAGGEILKFIGDAILAIFPLTESPKEACENALVAAEQSLSSLAAWSQQPIAEARPRLEAGIALHIGNVFFGNIGGRSRLDFTVIGSAVNEASSLESHCKNSYPLLVTKEFQQHHGENKLTSIGKKELKGINKEREIFTLTTMAQKIDIQ